jgi:hypothetical protein
MNQDGGASAALLQALAVVVLSGCIALILLERSMQPVARLRAWLARSAQQDREQQPVHLDADDLVTED